MNQNTNLSGWRKAGLVAGTVAVLAAGGAAVATQAVAAPGHHGSAKAIPAQAKSHAAKHHKAKHPKANGSVAQSLADAIAQVADGEASGLENSSDTFYGDIEQFGTVDFTAADGSGTGRVSEVDLNANQVKLFPRGHQDITECSGDMDSCQVSVLPDGSTLRTFVDRMDLGGLGTWELVVADRLVGDKVVHLVTDSARDEDGNVTSEHAPLSQAQLTALASLPVWAA